MPLSGFGVSAFPAAMVMVLAVTLNSRFERGATPISRLTSAIGTSMVIVPNGPVVNEQAPDAVICLVPGYVSAAPPPIKVAAFSPDQQLGVPLNSKYTNGFLPP